MSFRFHERRRPKAVGAPSMLDRDLVDCAARLIPNDDESGLVVFLEPVAVVVIEGAQ